MYRWLPLLTAPLLALAACGASQRAPDAGLPESTDGELAGPDASSPLADAAAEAPDAAAALPDAALPALLEQEPNNYGDGTEYNEVTPPFELSGTIGLSTHPDIDVFGAQLRAGDLWTWQLEGPSGMVAPYLYLLEKAGDVPYLVSTAASGRVAEQEQLVLATGLWYLLVADDRNPRDSTTLCDSAHPCVGGPAHDWRLTARPAVRAPIPVTFPSSMQGSLRHAQAIALYGFHAATTFRFDIDLKAKRKSPPSNLESRLSLFDDTNKRWVITNDGAGGSTDAHLGGDLLPAEANYVLIVENTDPGATDLSFQLDFSLRQ